MDRETIYFYDKPSHRVKEEHIFNKIILVFFVDLKTTVIFFK